MSFDELLTYRLILRNLRYDDAPVLFRYRSDPEVMRYQFWEPADLNEVQEFIESLSGSGSDMPGRSNQLAICLRDGGGMIGNIMMYFKGEDHTQVEIGITLAREHQGYGYATEALKAVVGYIFETLGKHRVSASVDPRNLKSCRLMERLGMRKEAHFRESIWFKGEWADDVVYAMLDREWPRGGSG